MAASFQCDQVIRDCPCLDDPISNFSSEEPDRPVFIANVNWGDPPPLNQFFIDLACLGFCFSFVSQEEADLCALQQAQFCVWRGYGPPGTPTYPNYPPRFGRGHFANAEQSCTIECDADGLTHTETVPAGLIAALTQEKADAQAHALACKMASHRAMCFGTQTLPSACVSSDYDVSLEVLGGTEPYTFTAGSGLPPGILLSSDGTLFGSPTTSGSYTFDVTVTDSSTGLDGSPATQTKSFTIAIGNITTTSLPDGSLGDSYSEALTQTGGVAPLTWTVTGGALPTGLSLDPSTGIISGTPTDVGTFVFEVTLTDSAP